MLQQQVVCLRSSQRSYEPTSARLCLAGSLQQDESLLLWSIGCALVMLQARRFQPHSGKGGQVYLHLISAMQYYKILVSPCDSMSSILGSFDKPGAVSSGAAEVFCPSHDPATR